MLKKSILVENDDMRLLLSVIKSNYVSENNDSIIEVNMEHVTSRIENENIRQYISDCWKNLQMKIGHEITLLENNCKKSIINRLYKKSRDLSFVVKTSPNDTSNGLHKSIKKASNIDVVIRDFNL